MANAKCLVFRLSLIKVARFLTFLNVKRCNFSGQPGSAGAALIGVLSDLCQFISLSKPWQERQIDRKIQL